MSRFRETKNALKHLCLDAQWMPALARRIADANAAAGHVSPLLALLIRPETRWQAVYGLGLAVPLVAADNMEQGRVIMRRLMWSLNEESGNLGWGVPEAMGAILAGSGPLAREFARILISYGYETGKDDNFLDYPPLRRGVYWAAGRLAQSDPAAAAPALPHLVRALADQDWPIRGMAAWALEQLAGQEQGPLATPEAKAPVAAALEKALAEAGDQSAAHADMDLLETEGIISITPQALLARSLDCLR